jgi:hypothetical protein
MAKARYAACMACRSDAQKVAGITDAQHCGLKLGRPKGTNHLTGIPKSEGQKEKTRAKNKAFWAANPDKLEVRAAKTRGTLNYNWKGGLSQFNQSVRQMRQNRKWIDAVKERDGFKCVRCGSTEKLESHHKIPLANLIEQFGIKTLDQARRERRLWEIENGETLCEACHYAEHGRRLAA